MKIRIDETAGFCFGVVRTINIAEERLDSNARKRKTYVLGSIIHNPKEIDRLEKEGLSTVTHEDFERIAGEGSELIVRAHGEPPSTFSKAKELGLDLVDATCPLVTGLQNRVKRFYDKGFQIVIYGKANHPEVIGIRGTIGDDCIIVSGVSEAEEKVMLDKKTVLFSQTTMEKPVYKKIKEVLSKRVSELIEGGETKDLFQAKNTLCKEVWGREKKVLEFARENDIVIFVAGRNSSNGISLFKHMKKENENMHYIEDSDELENEWFAGIETVGITGATSTPQWYLEKVKDRISEINELENIQ
jgi:4-hydroxy-3-methylbut-2-en-1-yl diphosphate reductase